MSTTWLVCFDKPEGPVISEGSQFMEVQVEGELGEGIESIIPLICEGYKERLGDTYILDNEELCLCRPSFRKYGGHFVVMWFWYTITFIGPEPENWELDDGNYS